MLKRIIIIFVMVVVFIAGFAFIYQQLQSKVESATSNYAQLYNIESISYADSQTYLQDKSGNYLLFFSGDDSDSKYVEESILPSVQENIGLYLIYIDMNEASDFGSTRFKTSWQFESYPAFAYVTITDGAIQINSVIESLDSDPITILSLRSWLNKNGIFKGTYE